MCPAAIRVGEGQDREGHAWEEQLVHPPRCIVVNWSFRRGMSLDTGEKQQLINTHQTHGTDTGSPEVQVAMLTERISRLSSHLQKNNHDFSSRQGLLKMIGRRKRLLGYMRNKSEQRYSDLISKLGIRG